MIYISAKYADLTETALMLRMYSWTGKIFVLFFKYMYINKKVSEAECIIKFFLTLHCSILNAGNPTHGFITHVNSNHPCRYDLKSEMFLLIDFFTSLPMIWMLSPGA